MDVESGLIAARWALCGCGGGDPALERSTVDPEPEKNRGVSQEAGAVADLRFESLLSLLGGGEGLVAHRILCFVVCAACGGELRLRSP